MPTSGFCFCDVGFAGADCKGCADVSSQFPDCGVQSFAYTPTWFPGISCAFCGQGLESYAPPDTAIDTYPPQAAWVLPPWEATVAPGTPIAVLLDEPIDPATVTTETFSVHAEGVSTRVAGNVVVQALAQGHTLLMFFPATLNLSGKYLAEINGISDTHGNIMSEWQDQFTIDGALGAYGFGNNLSFESGTSGCTVLGDGAALPGSGQMVPSHGNHQLVLSSGEPQTTTVSGDSGALGWITTIAICGPVPLASGATAISFDFDFGSSEFDTQLGKQWDDFAFVGIVGEYGGVGGLLTSVNLIGGEGLTTSAYGFPEVSDPDKVFRHAGTATRTIGNISDLGPWIKLVFVVTDVSDQSLNSVLTVDNVRWNGQ